MKRYERGAAGEMAFAQALNLEKPHIKKRWNFWCVCGLGRYADALTLDEAWRIWLSSPPRSA